MKKMNRRLTLVFSLLLLGCTTPEHRGPRIVSADDGAIIFSVLPNAQGASQHFKDWQNITVERTSGQKGEQGERYALRHTKDGTSRSTVYAGALPPGEYKILDFAAQNCDVVCATSVVKLGSAFSTFEVKSRTLTDLGVIVHTDIPFSDKKVAVAHDVVQDPVLAGELVKTYWPELQSMLGTPMLSWKKESVSDNMAALVAFGKSGSAGLVSPQETSDGSFIYGSANGMLFSLTPGARPVGHDPGLRRSIETTLVVSNGDWLVGGELSMLQLSSDRGRTWRSVRGDLPLGLVVSLKEWNSSVLLTILRGNRIDVHRADLRSFKWAQVASYEMDASIWDITDVRAQSFLLDGTLITTVPGRRVALLDLARSTSEIRALPGSVHEFSVSGDGVLRCRCVGSVMNSPYESHDMGKTWRPSVISRYMTIPTFRDARHGIAYAGGFKGKMVYTQDGGATWIDSIEIPAALREVFYSKDGKSAYAASAHGNFWVTRDDGRTWQPLRQ